MNNQLHLELEESNENHSKSIDVSILIPTKNGGELFQKTLMGIQKATQDIQTEVIVVDSGSIDKTCDYVRDFSYQLVKIPPEEFGHGKTRNYLATLAKGQILIFMTQDAVPSNEDWLKYLIKPFENPKVAGVYSRQVPRHQNVFENYFLEKTYHTKAYTTTTQEGKGLLLKEVFFSNVSAAYRKSVFDQILFSESHIISEDQVWAKEALVAGYSICYEPSSCVVHSHNYGLRKLFRRNFDVGVSLIGIHEDRRHRMIHDGLFYLFKEFWYLFKNGYWLQLIYFPFYEGCRYLGFMLGRKHKYFPKYLVKKWSLHRYYWD